MIKKINKPEAVLLMLLLMVWILFAHRVSPVELFAFEDTEGNYFDDYTHVSGINQSTMNGVTWDSSGSMMPSGTTSGELEADPSMEVLFHFNNEHQWEDDQRSTYDFAHQRHHAVWDAVGLFPASGRFGQAYFTVKNGVRKIPYFNSKGIQTNLMTASMWIKFGKDLAAGSSFVRLLWTVSGNEETYYIALSGGNIIRFYPDYRNRHFVNSGALAWKADEWHHVLTVLRSGKHELWIDGQLAGTLADDNGEIPFGDRFGIGRDWDLAFGADIAVDEFAVYNRALHPDEIQALARGERIRTGSFESGWIQMGGEFNSLGVELAGASTETMTVLISRDGTNWEEALNNQWIEYTKNKQLPCSAFKYKVTFSGGNPNARLDSIRFVWKNTADNPNEFVFVVYGDDRGSEGGGAGGLNRLKIIEYIKEINSPIVLHTGDMVNRGVDGTRWDWVEFGRSIEQLVARTPAPGLETSFFASIGNHESNPPHHGFFDVLNFSPYYSKIPVNAELPDCTNASGPGCNYRDPDNPDYYYNKYYHFIYRNTCFISLYYYDYDIPNIRGTNKDGTSELSTIGYTPQPIKVDDLSKASAQYKWLYKVLQDCDNNPAIKWKVVFMHYPPFSSGSHGTGDEYRNPQGTRKHLSTLLERFKVDLVISGHDHNYERTHPIKVTYNPEMIGIDDRRVFDGQIDENGITYIISGAGGMLNPAVHTPQPWSVRHDPILHFMKITVSGTAVRGEAIDINGTIFDAFTCGASTSTVQPPPDPDPDPKVDPSDMPIKTELNCRNNVINPLKGEETKLYVGLDAQMRVSVIIYDTKGKKVSTIIDEEKQAGLYTLTWNGTDTSGKAVGSGIYLVHMEAGNYTETKKIAVVK